MRISWPGTKGANRGSMGHTSHSSLKPFYYTTLDTLLHLVSTTCHPLLPSSPPPPPLYCSLPPHPITSQEAASLAFLGMFHIWALPLMAVIASMHLSTLLGLPGRQRTLIASQAKRGKLPMRLTHGLFCSLATDIEHGLENQGIYYMRTSSHKSSVALQGC